MFASAQQGRRYGHSPHLIIYCVYMNILFRVHSTGHLWKEDEGQLVGGHFLLPVVLGSELKLYSLA